MYAVDPVPKSMRTPNKIDDDTRTLTLLDTELERRLKDFRIKLHAEWWGNMGLEDLFLGTHIFLNRSQIKRLCHLADSRLLTTIDDLHDNFKWNWMDEYGVQLLEIIHEVYGEPSLAVADTTTNIIPNLSQPTLSNPSTVPVPTTLAPSHEPKKEQEQGASDAALDILLDITNPDYDQH